MKKKKLHYSDFKQRQLLKSKDKHKAIEYSFPMIGSIIFKPCFCLLAIFN